LRQVKGLPQVAQILLGRFPFCNLFVMITLYPFAGQGFKSNTHRHLAEGMPGLAGLRCDAGKPAPESEAWVLA
jgi:hypothetical protein